MKSNRWLGAVGVLVISVTFRSLAVTNPAVGTWTVGVYGRINAPYPYSGHFQTYSRR